MSNHNLENCHTQRSAKVAGVGAKHQAVPYYNTTRTTNITLTSRTCEYHVSMRAQWSEQGRLRGGRNRAQVRSGRGNTWEPGPRSRIEIAKAKKTVHKYPHLRLGGTLQYATRAMPVVVDCTLSEFVMEFRL